MKHGHGRRRKLNFKVSFSFRGHVVTLLLRLVGGNSPKVSLSNRSETRLKFQNLAKVGCRIIS